MQRARFAQSESVACNAEVRLFYQLDDADRYLLKAAMSQLNLSTQAYDRVLKLARTIAYIASADHFGPQHLAEARRYLLRTMNAW